MIIKGKSVTLDMDNISTDQIFPGRYVNLTDPGEIGRHVLEGVDINFKGRITPETILVVGRNFGCGSSREQAVITLRESGVKAVVASSAARIWYRNAINLALPVMICPDLVKKIEDGDELTIDLKNGKIRNRSSGNDFEGEPVSDFILDIFDHGGMKEKMRQESRRLGNNK